MSETAYKMLDYGFHSVPPSKPSGESY